VFLELLHILREKRYLSMCSARISPIISGIWSQNLYKVSLYSLCVVVANLCVYVKNSRIASFVGVPAPDIAFWGNITNRYYRYNRCNRQYVFEEEIRGFLNSIITSFYKSVKTFFTPLRADTSSSFSHDNNRPEDIIGPDAFSSRIPSSFRPDFF
jgi:hypothetical protein